MAFSISPASRNAATRAVLGIVDAGVSSLGNLAISLLAARSMPVADFGVFATAMIGLLIATGLSRALHGDALILKTTTIKPAQFLRDAKSSLDSAATLGGCLCALLGVAASFAYRLTNSTSSALPSLLLACAVAAPLLLLQDQYRWIEYARSSMRAAVINTTLWTIGSATAMIGLGALTGGNITPSDAILAWGASSLPAILYAVWHSGIRPRPARPGWLRSNRTLSFRLAQDFTLLQASTQGAQLLLSALSPATAFGLLRKAQLFLSPVNVATNGLMSALQPILVRRWATDGYRGVVRVAGTVAGLGGLLTAAYGILVASIPESAAVAAVGEGWSGARPYVAPLFIQAGMGLVGGCAGLSLRAMGKVGDQVKIRGVVAPVSLLAVATSALLAGPLTATWALAGISSGAAALWSALVFRARNDAHAQASTAP